MKAPAPLAYDTEQRFLLVVMTLCVLALLGVPTFDLMLIRESWSYRLSVTTEYPRLIPIGFTVAVGLLVPVLYCVRKRWALRLACLGGCMGSFSSYGMAYVGRNMDVGALLTSFLNWFAFYFVIAGSCSLVYAAAIAILLNSHMLQVLNGEVPHETT